MGKYLGLSLLWVWITFMGICEPLGRVSVDNIGRYLVDVSADMSADTWSSYQSTYRPTPGRYDRLLVDMLADMLSHS